MDFLSKLCFLLIFISFLDIKFCEMKSPDSQVLKADDGHDANVDFIAKQYQKFVDKGKKCSLKKITLKSLNHLRLSAEDDTSTTVCLLSALKDKDFQSSGVLWTALGSLFLKQGQTSPAATSFKHAAKLTGKVSTFLRDWSFLGPFVIGKSELDGDPVESFGGIAQAARFRYKKGVKFYSELVPGGEVEWSHMKQSSESAGVQVGPAVNWNELVNSLGSMGIMEWQGWLVGELAVTEREANIVLQCLGVHTVYINNVPVTGDIYHRNQFWFGVKLTQGLHTVYVKLRTEVKGQFVCKFQTAKNSYAILEPHYLPDLVSGHLFSGHFTVPVLNYQHTSVLKITNIVLTDQVAKSGDLLNKLDVSLVDRDVTVAPGQVAHVSLQLKSRSGKTTIISGCSEPESAWDVKFTVKFTTSAGTASLPVSVRCRHDRQSFLFTFEDHDGSIQHAAAIQPLQGCPADVCPVVLSLHGTSIPPQNQADSYKHMVDGEFVFGFNQAWTLAPTRQGAHNWEGPGSLTALTALDRLETLSKQADFFKNSADAQHVVFAGHSMGGHGAWHIATHYPDRALALVSLAGWIKKEEYGDDNMFFRHDIATSHVDPAVKAILESCVVENDVDQHVSNLHGIAMVTRIGGADRTVHPVFARRMSRLMKEEGFMVEHTELAGKEHWWWDTQETNDGGAVHDQYLRDFTERHITAHLLAQESSCGAGESGECGSQPAGSRYAALGDTGFTLTCYNPAATGSMHGLRILQQLTPHRKSVVEVAVLSDTISLHTSNVQKIALSHSPNRQIQWQNYQLTVDDSNVVVTETMAQDIRNGGHFGICRSDGQWTVCEEEEGSTAARSLSTLGPARRVAEQPFIIVIGTTGSAASQLYLQQSAIYIANLFFLTSDTRVVIKTDTDVAPQDLDNTNVIVIGNSTENLHTDKLLESLPMKLTTDGLRLGGCRFRERQVGLLTLAPNGPSHLALLLLGASLEALLDVVSLAAPTIPPMTRSPFSNLLPDYVITGPSLGRKGPGGYLCTGYYGNSWQYRPDLSSCACV